MNYNFLINEFNRLKWNYISKITGIEYKPVELETEEAMAIWCFLCKKIEQDQANGLSEETCIFCLNHCLKICRCYHCEWGQSNGKCTDDTESVYNKVYETFQGLGNEDILSNLKYRELLEAARANYFIKDLFDQEVENV